MILTTSAPAPLDGIEIELPPAGGGGQNLEDFLPPDYQVTAGSFDDPVFQNAYANWFAATMPVLDAPATDAGGPSLASDIWLMATSPVATTGVFMTTGVFITGVGDTFSSGAAADSLAGAEIAMVDTMVGWTGIYWFQAENAAPIFGNYDAFQDGQTVGVVWGTTNNLALLSHSIVNLPGNISSLMSAGGSTILVTAEGTQLVGSGAAVIEAAIPVAVNLATGVESTIAMAMTGPNDSPNSVNPEIPRPSIPSSTISGRTFQSWGRDVVEWGSGAADALARIESLTLSEIQRPGITRAQAEAGLQFYSQEFLRNPGNTTAGARVQLMQHIISLL